MGTIVNLAPKNYDIESSSDSKQPLCSGTDRLGQPMRSLVHCGGKYGCENGRSNAQRRYIEVILLTTS